MKIKSFLYNQEQKETVELAYLSVSSIAKQLGIKLKSKKDFEDRMTYAFAVAKKNRYHPKENEITTITVGLRLSSSSSWKATVQESFSYDLSRELTDINVSDIGNIANLLGCANSLVMTICINRRQAWRRQVRLKPTTTLSSLSKS